jgi:hypothetical protein
MMRAMKNSAASPRARVLLVVGLAFACHKSSNIFGTIPGTGGAGAAAGANGGTGGESPTGGAGGEGSGAAGSGGFVSGGGGGAPGTGGTAGNGAGGSLGSAGMMGTAALPLAIGTTRRTLVDQKGAPFLIHGDAGWSLISAGKREDVDRYLDDRSARGVNATQIVLIDHITPPQNAYGQTPFTTAGDFSTPNEAYFAQADWVIKRAWEKGFVVFLSPCYLGYGGGSEGFYQDVVKNGATKMRDYGRWVGQRYKDFDNIVWLEAGDYAPPASGLALLNAMVEGIKEKDTRHIHAVHWGPETSGREVSVPWLDLNTTYTYQPVYLKALADHADKTRPFVLLETTYENEHNASAQLLRSQAYYALLAGATGQFFGTFPVWKLATGWPNDLNSRGSNQMKYVRALFAPRAWYTLEPDQKNETLVAGQGTYGTGDYALLARGTDGRLAIAYLPTMREVTINMARMAGPSIARWYDPANGTFTPIDNAPSPNTGQRKFTPPGTNGDLDKDWLLVIEVMP